jgi:hypothetical protein
MDKTGLVNLLKDLKSRGLLNIKAEYEAEGSTDEEIFFLKELCDSAGLGVHVKIGGVEAKRDFRRCLIIGVEGIIAPMVENEFCASKFIGMFKSDEEFYGEKIWDVHRSINIETKYAIPEIDKIIERVGDQIHNITIGRTDLSASYFDDRIKQDAEEVTKAVKKVLLSIHSSKKNIIMTVGGGVTSKTIKPLLSDSFLVENIQAIETRKCRVDTKKIIEDPSIIDDILEFEMAYLQNRANEKKVQYLDKAKLEELHTLDTTTANARLEDLKSRLSKK